MTPEGSGAMHVPDGFVNAGTAAAAGVISAGAVGYSLRQTRHQMSDRQIPLAGLTAAFVFAAQMVNFPVAAGTTGHLLGAAMAAVLLGPSMGAVVVTVVVVVQALVFADGGLTALGLNVLNLAIIPAYGGYAVFRLFRKVLPRSRSGVVAATGLAGGLSVVLAAMAFSLEWLFGATAPVPFDTVFSAMVGVHIFIGVGEGVISAVAVGAVLASRPDIVFGARDLDAAELADRTPIRTRTFLLAGLLVALGLAAVVSQFAAGNPDGLERVAADTGIAATAQEHALGSGWFAAYATDGVRNEALSLAIAGVAGVVITTMLGLGIIFAVRDRGGGPRAPAAT